MLNFHLKWKKHYHFPLRPANEAAQSIFPLKKKTMGKKERSGVAWHFVLRRSLPLEKQGIKTQGKAHQDKTEKLPPRGVSSGRLLDWIKFSPR